MLTLLIQSAAALVLLFAGAQKLANPSDVASTVRALGLPGSGWAPAAILGLAEIGAAAAMVLAPHALATSGLVIGLGAAFAIAGAIALLRRVRVHCACLGPGLSGDLGARQLAALPLWAAAGGAGIVDRSTSLAGQRAELLVVLAIVVTLGVLVRLAPLAREHRTQLDALPGR